MNMPIRNIRVTFIPLLEGAKCSKMDKTVNRLLIFPLSSVLYKGFIYPTSVTFFGLLVFLLV
jgi:hypothetical protein